MFHEDFKIIVNGKELSYPFLRLLVFGFACFVAGLIMAL